MTAIAALDLARRVERLLAPWDRAGSPGVSVALIRDGGFALRRHAGLASVEHGVAIGDETRFRVASVTKQFTCLAVLLLAAEGRLAVDDDVRKHLPDFPDLGVRITLDHLMRNASGVRDMFELMRLGGLDLHQHCGVEDFLAAINRQRGLNFAPGARFLYSNSNFLLLGRVVERVSGMALAEFLQCRVFAPLGMTRTRLVARTDEVVPGLAASYLARPEAPGGFVRAGHNFAMGGEGGLVSTVEDLALWDRNFATGRVGGQAVMAALAAQAPFANGRLNAYARGLEVQTYRGLHTVGHGGLWPGFKTLFLRVPEKRLTMLCIANLDTVDVHALGHLVLDAALADDDTVEKLPPLPERAALERATGRYLDRASGATLELSLGEDARPACTMYGATFPLLPVAGGRLQAHRGAFPLTLALTGDGAAVEAEFDAGVTARFERVAASAPKPADLSGSYVSEEAAARWTIAAAGEGAALTIDGPLAKAGPWRIEGIAEDIVRIHVAATWHHAAFDARVRRGGDGKVAGLEVSGGRVKNMRLRRVDG